MDKSRTEANQIYNINRQQLQVTREAVRRAGRCLGARGQVCRLISEMFEEASGDVDTRRRRRRRRRGPTRRGARGRDASSQRRDEMSLHPAVCEVCHGFKADCENLMEGD
ncbi:hypothetical protein F2P81_008339 [Scophthalmus maximus]|uniref:Uncharacterized protein n=1 Tax=Scophthalmus maximus TaxID=52904 RepID=A0A6A4TAA9_SCOMX|nr:hypothetical protein F2P81_008339 [Scophthalmus maximus]